MQKELTHPIALSVLKACFPISRFRGLSCKPLTVLGRGLLSDCETDLSCAADLQNDCVVVVVISISLRHACLRRLCATVESSSQAPSIWASPHRASKLLLQIPEWQAVSIQLARSSISCQAGRKPALTCSLHYHSMCFWSLTYPALGSGRG